MITLEQVKIIREKKYFPNTPGDKKPKGILRNIGDYIRKTGADPMRGDYGSETKIFAKGDKTKPLYRGGETSQGMQTTQNIKKGSIPDPKKLLKKPTILPPAGSDTEAVQKNLLTGEDDYSKIKSRRGRKPGSVNKPKVDKTPGQLDLFNQPKPKSKPKPTKGVNQAEISKKATEFTAKVNKRRLERGSKRAERIKGATGGKTTGSLAKGNLSFPGDRSGAYSSAKTDLETKKLLKKAGASGDVSPTAGSEIRKRVETIRKTRADKLGTPDPFDADYSKKVKKVDSRSKISKAFKAPTTSDIKKGKLPKGYTAPKGEFPTKPVVKTFKKFQQDSGNFNAKKQAIKDIRASDQRLGKPLSKVQQRKEALRKSKEYTAKQLRQIRMQREFGGGLSGTIGPPTGGTSSSKPSSVVSTSKPKDVVPKTFKVDEPSKYKSTDAYKQQTQFINKKTGKRFNMNIPSDRDEYLRQQGKQKFINQTKKNLTDQEKFVQDFTSKSKRTYSQRTTSYQPKPSTKTNFVKKILSKGKRFLPKGGGGRLGLALTGAALAYGGYKFLTRPKSTLKTKTTPIKLNKNTKNISPTSVQFNPKNDPLKLTKAYKKSITFKDLSQFGKGKDKAYSVPGGIKSGIYTPTELKNVQRRVKQNKKEIDSKTGFYKGDPYGMLDVKTNKKSQRFIDAVKMNKNKN